uniref:CAM Kinase, RAD family, putative n=1 Tax=Neospora caninum (strain Liverpool) TaxID=572307 RepID=A0A0F7U8H0_NEOCL|nr:TPA: CAM Kinase, RAD family, putative [Neospora caninum Liverpool]
MASNQAVDAAERERQDRFEIIPQGSFPPGFSPFFPQSPAFPVESMTKKSPQLSGFPSPGEKEHQPNMPLGEASLRASSREGTPQFASSSSSSSRLLPEEKDGDCASERQARTTTEREGDTEKTRRGLEAKRTERQKAEDDRQGDGAAAKEGRGERGRDREDGEERRLRSCPHGYSSASFLAGLTAGGPLSVPSSASKRSRHSRAAKETRAQLTQLFNEFAEPRPCRTAGSGPPLMHLIRHTCGGCRTGKVLDKSALLCLFSHLPAMVFERFFDLLDEDGDERVDLKEFCKGLDMFCSQDEEKLLRFLFNLCDLDGNGLIEREELRTLLYHLPFRLWKFSRRGERRSGRRRERSRERRERRASSLPSPSLLRHRETEEFSERAQRDETCGEEGETEREGFPGGRENKRRSRLVGVMETNRYPFSHGAPPRAQPHSASSDEASPTSYSFASALTSGASSSSEEEEEDSLRFDEKDQLVRKRIDEIVEAAFQHKQRKPDRDFRNLFSFPSHAAKGQRGRERIPPPLSQPIRKEEGLTFEEFLAALEQNREIHDAFSGAVDIENFLFDTCLWPDSSAGPPHPSCLPSPPLLPTAAPSSPTHPLPLVPPVEPPCLSSLSSSPPAASPSPVSSPASPSSSDVALSKGDDRPYLSLSHAVPSLPCSLPLPFRQERATILSLSNTGGELQRSGRICLGTNLPALSDSTSSSSSSSSSSSASSSSSSSASSSSSSSASSSSSSSASSSSSSSVPKSEEGQREGNTDFCGQQTRQPKQTPGSFASGDRGEEAQKQEHAAGERKRGLNEKRHRSLGHLLSYALPRWSPEKGETILQRRSFSLRLDATPHENDRQHLRRVNRFFSLFSPKRTLPRTPAGATPREGTAEARTKGGDEKAGREQMEVPRVRTPGELGGRGRRGDGNGGTEKPEEARDAAQEERVDKGVSDGAAKRVFPLPGVLPSLPDPSPIPRFPAPPSLPSSCCLSLGQEKTDSLSADDREERGRTTPPSPSPSSLPPVPRLPRPAQGPNGSRQPSTSPRSSPAFSLHSHSVGTAESRTENRTPRRLSSSSESRPASPAASPPDSCSLVVPLGPTPLLTTGERRRRRSLAHGLFFSSLASSVYEVGGRGADLRRPAQAASIRERRDSDEEEAETAEDTEAEAPEERREREAEKRDFRDRDARSGASATQLLWGGERRREERRGCEGRRVEEDSARRGRRESSSGRLSKGRSAVGAAITEGARALLSRFGLAKADRDRESYLLNFLDADEELQMHGWLWKIGQHFGAWVRRYYFLTGKHLWWQSQILSTRPAHCLYLHGCSVHALVDDPFGMRAPQPASATSPTFTSPVAGTHGRYALEIIKPNGRVGKRLYAVTADERQAWLEALQLACGVEDFHDFYCLHAEEVLGQGKYGTVKLAHEKATGKMVAVKILDKGSIQSQEDREFTRREMEVVKVLQHPNLVQTLDVFDRTGPAPYAYIVMELLPHRDLGCLIRLTRVIQYLSLKLLLRQRRRFLQARGSVPETTQPVVISSLPRPSPLLFPPLSAAPSPFRNPELGDAVPPVRAASPDASAVLPSSSSSFAASEAFAASSLEESFLETDFSMDGRWLLEEHVILRIVTGLLKATRHMHSKGVVHRDLKPENLLLLLSAAPGEAPDARDCRRKDEERNCQEPDAAPETARRPGRWDLSASGGDRASQRERNRARGTSGETNDESAGERQETALQWREHQASIAPRTERRDSPFPPPTIVIRNVEGGIIWRSPCAASRVLPFCSLSNPFAPHARSASSSSRAERERGREAPGSRPRPFSFNASPPRQLERENGATGHSQGGTGARVAGAPTPGPGNRQNADEPPRDSSSRFPRSGSLLGVVQPSVASGYPSASDATPLLFYQPPASLPFPAAARSSPPLSPFSSSTPSSRAQGEGERSYTSSPSSSLPASVFSAPRPAWHSSDGLIEDLKDFPKSILTADERKELEEWVPAFLSRSGCKKHLLCPSRPLYGRSPPLSRYAGCTYTSRQRSSSFSAQALLRDGARSLSLFLANGGRQLGVGRWFGGRQEEESEAERIDRRERELEASQRRRSARQRAAPNPLSRFQSNDMILEERDVGNTDAGRNLQPRAEPDGEKDGEGERGDSDYGGRKRQDRTDRRGLDEASRPSSAPSSFFPASSPPPSLSLSSPRGATEGSGSSAGSGRGSGQPDIGSDSGQGDSMRRQEACRDRGTQQRSVPASPLSTQFLTVPGPRLLPFFEPLPTPSRSRPTGSLAPPPRPGVPAAPSRGERGRRRYSSPSAVSEVSRREASETQGVRRAGRRHASLPASQGAPLPDERGALEGLSAASQPQASSQLSSPRSPSPDEAPSSLDSGDRSRQDVCRSLPVNVSSRSSSETVASPARQDEAAALQSPLLEALAPTRTSSSPSSVCSRSPLCRPRPQAGNEAERLQWCMRVLRQIQERLVSIKVADFGFSAVLAPNWRASDSLGTLAYAAPEVLVGLEYDKAVDMWSIGVITFELLSQGVLPFQGKTEQQIGASILEGHYSFDFGLHRRIGPFSPRTVSGAARDFVSRLLCHPARRMNIEEALNHPWIANAENDLTAPPSPKRFFVS